MAPAHPVDSLDDGSGDPRRIGGFADCVLGFSYHGDIRAGHDLGIAISASFGHCRDHPQIDEELSPPGRHRAVTKGGTVVTTRAFGPSMTGVPATPAMHFRNGAVAFAYVATLLMEYVDERKVSLNDPISRWMPKLPEANKVTLKMLANQTSGYPDFETDPAWTAAFNADPFHLFTYQERLRYAFARPSSSPRGRTGATRTRTS